MLRTDRAHVRGAAIEEEDIGRPMSRWRRSAALGRDHITKSSGCGHAGAPWAACPPQFPGPQRGEWDKWLGLRRRLPRPKLTRRTATSTLSGTKHDNTKTE